MSVQPIRKIVTPEIPDKLYFRIGDVARICEVPAYVLRFWETEFPQLKPNKGGTGQRLYRKRDVEMALRIKSLLYDQGYTIPGARQVFKNEGKSRETAAAEIFAPAPAPVPAQMAAQPIPEVAAMAVAPAAEPAHDAGEEFRRTVKLHALREELRAMLAMLNTPLPGQPAAVPEPKPMRPRLVLEPRLATPKAELARLPESLRLLVREQPQGDLFPTE